MEYFTPERYLRLQQFDDPSVLERAMAEWDTAVERYNTGLLHIRDRFPDGVRTFLDDYCLHDAVLVGTTSDGERRTYRLLVQEEGVEGLTELVYFDAEPSLDESTFPADFRTGPVLWLYDEMAANPRVLPGWSPLILHSVLLSDGRELTVRFRDFKVSRVQPFVPTTAATVS